MAEREEPTMGDERTELLDALTGQRDLLRTTVRDIDDDQSRQRTTVSELTLGWVLKHVSGVEKGWVDFLVDRADIADQVPETPDWENPDYPKQWAFRDDETLADLLAEYEAVAERTEKVVRELPDLDKRYRMHETPWNPPGLTWSARQILYWILRETSHHCGHADIIRESLDGAKTMSF